MLLVGKTEMCARRLSPTCFATRRSSQAHHQCRCQHLFGPLFLSPSIIHRREAGRHIHSCAAGQWVACDLILVICSSLDLAARLSLKRLRSSGSGELVAKIRLPWRRRLSSTGRCRGRLCSSACSRRSVVICLDRYDLVLLVLCFFDQRSRWCIRHGLRLAAVMFAADLT